MITYAVLAILNVASPMIGDKTVYKEINDSHIAKAMYENNLILNIVL